jgi:hypothetical protein
MLKALVGKTDGFKKFVVTCSVSLVLMGSFSALVSAQTFEPVVNLSGNPGGAEDHQVVANGNNVYVVWSDTTPGNFDIFFRRSTDGGATWGPILNLSANKSTSRFPKLAVSGTAVFVVWGDFTANFTQQNIMFRRSLDGGGTFESIQQLSATPGSFPVIAASGANVYVVWGDASFGGGDIFLRRSIDAGASFEAIQTLSLTGAAPQVAASGANVYVVWDNGDSITFRRSTDGGANFETPLNLFPTGLLPQLALSGSSVFLVWESRASPSDVFFARSTDGGITFGPAVNLSANASSSHLPQLAVSGPNVFVAWIDDAPGNPNIFFRRSADGGGTFEAVQNLSNTVGNALYPRVAVSGSRIYVVWQDCNPLCFTPVDVFFRSSSDGGATFNSVLNLSEDGGSALPELAVSTANVYVIWKNFLAGSGDIFFRRAVESDMPLLGWPFIEPTGWAITGFGTGDCKGVNEATEGDHCGDDWYAQDWNFGSGNDDLGKVLLSATTGRVIFSGSWDGYGKEAIIQLNPPFEDFALRYTHLKEVWVTEGDEVCLGSPVGVVGFTGLSGGGQNTSHLHAVLYQKINEISARGNKGETGLFWLERGEPVESIRSGTPATKFAAPLAFNPTMRASGCSEAFVLAGRVTTSANQGVPNVTLRLSGPISMETTPFVERTGRKVGGGNYAFRDLPNGTYTVTPERRGYIFDPPSRTVTIAGGHVSGVDFVAIPLTTR